MGKKLAKIVTAIPEALSHILQEALDGHSSNEELRAIEQDSTFIAWEGETEKDDELFKNYNTIKAGDIVNIVAHYQTGNKPLMFTTDSDAENELGANSYNSDITCYYSYNGREWTKWETDYETLSFSKERPLYIKGDNPNGLYTLDIDDETQFQFYFDNSEPVYCSDNIMSLLGEDITEIPCDYCFKDLFNGCKALVTAPELPATKLADNCYESMFYGCTSLVTAPELPATELTYGCYLNMFNRCSKLVNAPALPATELAENCYQNMFSNCRALVTAPELPATELTTGCYQGMFSNCRALINAPVLSATELTKFCYVGMFKSCDSLTQIVTYQSVAPNETYNLAWVSDIETTGTMYAPNSDSWGIATADGNTTYPTTWKLVKSAPPAA